MPPPDDDPELEGLGILTRYEILRRRRAAADRRAGRMVVRRFAAFDSAAEPVVSGELAPVAKIPEVGTASTILESGYGDRIMQARMVAAALEERRRTYMAAGRAPQRWRPPLGPRRGF